jgi:DNA-binding SARP family transcriptional activator
VKFRVLGAVDLLTPQRSIEVRPPQRGAVLVALLVDVGRPVPPETLLDRVWDEPPAAARRALHAHITRLRQMVARGDEPTTLARRSGGYVLDVAPDQVDLHRFRRLVSAAREAPGPDLAQGLLRQALGLWRGTPLANIPGGWAARVREGLLHQRLDAAVLLADGQLRLGDPPGGHQPGP